MTSVRLLIIQLHLHLFFLPFHIFISTIKSTAPHYIYWLVGHIQCESEPYPWTYLLWLIDAFFGVDEAVVLLKYRHTSLYISHITSIPWRLSPFLSSMMSGATQAIPFMDYQDLFNHPVFTLSCNWCPRVSVPWMVVFCFWLGNQIVTRRTRTTLHNAFYRKEIF
ncbi:hypothetical protein BKA64DRAFT_664240 [Cadophora sp. MPI-SDFR-AT-0126]|nr:hypothetical protein BKA64DRAFT_664240 [Leotiomycetes sp. MPI-SDFR-AT-0126]